jgi:hypothetical protein
MAKSRLQNSKSIARQRIQPIGRRHGNSHANGALRGGRDALPARRAAIGCILNRLMLLTAGNEPKLAELFARAELKRGSYAASATSAASMDWVSSAENLGLRGTL